MDPVLFGADIERTVERFARIAYAGLTPALVETHDDDGRPCLKLDMEKLTPEMREVLEISGSQHDVKIRQAPRLDALRELSRILGLYAEDRRDDAEAKLLKAAQRVLHGAQESADDGITIDAE